MRGPKPIPTVVKIARGNPGKRALNHDFPEPRHEAPPVPEVLTGRAKQHWDFLVAQLAEIGTLAITDGGLLSAYSMALAQLEECHAAIDRDGLVITLRNDKGEVKSVQASPHVKLARSLMANIKSMASELGLSPTSRTRLKGTSAAAPVRDEWDEILSA